MRPPISVHLTNAYHATSGGIRTMYRALLTSASHQARQMHLVVPAAESWVEHLDRWTTIHHVAAANSPWFDRRYRLLRPVHYAGRRSPVGRILAAVRPDIVEVCDKYTLAQVGRLVRAGWFWRGHRPTAIGLSCERMDDNVAAYLPGGRWLAAAASAYIRTVYATAFDAHLANSAYTADELIQQGVSRVAVCGMGVDVACFLQAAPDAALRASLLRAAGGAQGSLLVLYAGRVSPEKHLDRLVRAVGGLARRPGADVRLVVAGDGPAMESLRSLAGHEAPGRVHWLGNVGERSTLATLYASADVFAHPNDREPFGIGPLEAMAAGVPVVVPNRGGVLSYARDDNAWLAAPTAEGLGAAVLAAGLGRDASRIAKARATAEAHAWPTMAQRYFDTLDRLHIARHAGAASRIVAPPAVGSRA